jgi:hypothetical protein
MSAVKELPYIKLCICGGHPKLAVNGWSQWYIYCTCDSRRKTKPANTRLEVIQEWNQKRDQEMGLPAGQYVERTYTGQ